MAWGAVGQMGGSLIDVFGNFYGQSRLQKDQQNWYESMMRDQFEQLQEMYPLTGILQNLGMDIYGDKGNQKEIIRFLENPIRLTNLERQLFEFFGGQPSGWLNVYGARESGPFGGRGYEMLGEATGLLKSLIPYGEDLAGTGFRTDIQPAEDYALRLLEREMVPELAERFGANITGSGFQNALLGAAGDVASELGSLQVALDEAAASRRLQALQSGTVQNLFTAPLNLTTGFLTAGAQAGEAYRQAAESSRPGARLLGYMPQFVQAATSGGFIQPGYPTGGTSAGNLFSALGQAAPSMLGNVGRLVGGLLDNWLDGQGNNSNTIVGSGGITPTGGTSYMYGPGAYDQALSVLEGGSLFR